MKPTKNVRPDGDSTALARVADATDVTNAFGPRVLPIDGAVADIWGQISARRSVPVIDGLLAATALAHNLVLVTRNIADVDGLGARLLNPFASP